MYITTALVGTWEIDATKELLDITLLLFFMDIIVCPMECYFSVRLSVCTKSVFLLLYASARKNVVTIRHEYLLATGKGN